MSRKTFLKFKCVQMGVCFATTEDQTANGHRLLFVLISAEQLSFAKRASFAAEKRKIRNTTTDKTRKKRRNFQKMWGYLG